jgi:hypothetical protein
MTWNRLPSSEKMLEKRWGVKNVKMLTRLRGASARRERGNGFGSVE